MRNFLRNKKTFLSAIIPVVMAVLVLVTVTVFKYERSTIPGRSQALAPSCTRTVSIVYPSSTPTPGPTATPTLGPTPTGILTPTLTVTPVPNPQAYLYGWISVNGAGPYISPSSVRCSQSDPTVFATVTCNKPAVWYCPPSGRPQFYFPTSPSAGEQITCTVSQIPGTFKTIIWDYHIESYDNPPSSAIGNGYTASFSYDPAFHALLWNFVK